MSKKDRIRAEQGIIIRNTQAQTVQYFRCEKCKHSIPEYLIVEHLNKCQMGITTCGKCDQQVKAEEFLDHYWNCQGKVSYEPIKGE